MAYGSEGSAARSWTSAVIVELLAIAGLAGLEPLAIAGTPAIVSLHQLPAGFVRISGGFGRTRQIVIGSADFTLGTTLALCH